MPVTCTRTRLPLTPPQAVAETTGLVFTTGAPAGTGGAAVVLAHGAGSGPDSDVLHTVAARLAEHGHVVLSFAFAYWAAGRRAPDPLARRLSALADAVAWARTAFGRQRRLILGGRSMGGRSASILVAEGQECAGLVLLAYPLHAPLRTGWRDEDGRPPALRTEHWPALRGPVLFVQGDRDVRTDLSLLDQARRDRLSGPSSVHVVQGADHGFRVRKRDHRAHAEILEEVADTVVAWVDARAGV